MSKILKNLFSIKNEYSGNKKHKVITILGIKLKIKLSPKFSKKNLESKKTINDYWIADNVVLKNLGNVDIDDTAFIAEGVVIQNGPNTNIKIGKYSQINPYCVLYGGDIEIGDCVMIAPHCVIVTGNHNHKQTEKPMRFADDTVKGNNKNIIEDDVWIGANSTIGANVHIHTGAVIGANSFVNKDVPPFAIMGGVPAKILGYRK